MPDRSMNPDVLMISTADWDADLQTNKQYTAKSLRETGSTVLYVESMGVRAPTLARKDLARIVKRLRQMVVRPIEVTPRIWRLSPPVIPLQRYRVVRLINRVVASAVVFFWARRLLSEDFIFWTYNPLTTKLLNLKHRRHFLVYHCVDDIAAQPLMPSSVIEAAELELLERADAVFVTSRELERKFKLRRSDVEYFPNVIDESLFKEQVEAVNFLDKIPRPRLGFVGALTAYKVDVALLGEIADSYPEWQVVLVGPIEGHEFDLVLSKPNVTCLGLQPGSAIPGIMRELDVGLIPANINRYTASMFPLKFFEYMACGLPVVATNLSALQEFRDVAEVVEREDFLIACERALLSKEAGLTQRTAVALANTYAERTRKMQASVASKRR